MSAIFSSSYMHNCRAGLRGRGCHIVLQINFDAFVLLISRDGLEHTHIFPSRSLQLSRLCILLSRLEIVLNFSFSSQGSYRRLSASGPGLGSWSQNVFKSPFRYFPTRFWASKGQNGSTFSSLLCIHCQNPHRSAPKIASPSSITFR